MATKTYISRHSDYKVKAIPEENPTGTFETKHAVIAEFNHNRYSTSDEAIQAGLEKQMGFGSEFWVEKAKVASATNVVTGAIGHINAQPIPPAPKPTPAPVVIEPPKRMSEIEAGNDTNPI